MNPPPHLDMYNAGSLFYQHSPQAYNECGKIYLIIRVQSEYTFTKLNSVITTYGTVSNSKAII